MIQQAKTTSKDKSLGLFFEESSLVTKITALCIWKNFLFVGEGCYLSLYFLEDGSQLHTRKVLRSNAIHQIKCWSSTADSKNLFLICVGQRSFSALHLDAQTLAHCCDVATEYETDDWILDALIFQDGTSISIGTCHNRVISLRSSSLAHDKCLQGRCRTSEEPTFGLPAVSSVTRIGSSPSKERFMQQCSENSLLYCGLLSGSSWKDFLMIGGTPFGQIIIWRPSQDVRSTIVPPLLTVDCHKGSIFSISFDKEKNLLTTTSDDRSIKVWSFYQDDRPEFLDRTAEPWNLKEIVSCSGHSARVWRSLILSETHFVSCGEDSLLCWWSMDGFLLHSLVAHSGASIWSIARCGSKIISGGSDGSIRQWKLREDRDGHILRFECLPWLKEIPQNQNCLETDDIIAMKDNGSDFPRTVDMISSGMFLVVTNFGVVWVWNSVTHVWSLVYHNRILRGYSISSCLENKICAIGTLDGSLILLKIVKDGPWEVICESQEGKGKIQAIIWVTEDLVVVSAGQGLIELYKLSYSHDFQDADLVLLQEHVLPPCRQRWITTAVRKCASESDAHLLLVGDTAGSIHVYAAKIKEPVQTLKGIHGSHGVTSLHWSREFVISSGRDGCVRYFTAKKAILEELMKTKFSPKSWIAGIAVFNNLLLSIVFCGNKLQLWHLLNQNIILEVNCGGGHRSWGAFIGNQKFVTCSSNFGEKEEVLSNLFDFSCVFLKDGSPELHKHSLGDKILPAIKTGASGREIQCLKPLWSFSNSCFVAFGGEDTLMHLARISPAGFTQIYFIKSHLSSIRSLGKVERLPRIGGEELDVIWLLSAGGRAQLKLWKVTLTDAGKRSSTDAGSPRESTSHPSGKDLPLLEGVGAFDPLDPPLIYQEVSSFMLRSKAGLRASWKSQRVAFDPETRFMDGLSFWIRQDLALLILASSDGFLRFLKFTFEEQFELIEEFDCEFCLLRLAHIESTRGLFICASTTRGQLIFWDLEDLVSHLLNESQEMFKMVAPLNRLQVRSCGVSALASNPFGGRSGSLLAAGGDDGALSLIKVSFAPKTTPSRANYPAPLELSAILGCCETRHASLVSGVCWISDDRLATCSVDQRLILWKIEDLKLQPLVMQFISVPDVHGMHLQALEGCSSPTGPLSVTASAEGEETSQVVAKLILYGVGIQTFNVVEKR